MKWQERISEERLNSVDYNIRSGKTFHWQLHDNNLLSIKLAWEPGVRND